MTRELTLPECSAVLLRHAYLSEQRLLQIECHPPKATMGEDFRGYKVGSESRHPGHAKDLTVKEQ